MKHSKEQIEFIRAKIEKAEKSGFAKKQTRDELLAEIKSQILKK